MCKWDIFGDFQIMSCFFLILGSILKSWKVAKILFFSALLRKKLWIVAKDTKVIFQKKWYFTNGCRIQYGNDDFTIKKNKQNLNFINAFFEDKLEPP